MNLEINTYGICLDSAQFYVALSWLTVITLSVAGAIIKLYQHKKTRKGKL